MGQRPNPDWSAYAVSKAGLSRLTDSLAAALDGTGVVVLEVSPGLVRTDMTETMRATGTSRAGTTRRGSSTPSSASRAATSTGCTAGSCTPPATTSTHCSGGPEDRGPGGPHAPRLRPYGADDPLT